MNKVSVIYVNKIKVYKKTDFLNTFTLEKYE